MPHMGRGRLIAAITLLLAPILFSAPARSQATESGLTFDVATLKPSPPVPLGTPIAINLGAVRNGTVTLGNVNLAECIQFAYLMPSAKQIVGPEWMQ